MSIISRIFPAFKTKTTARHLVPDGKGGYREVKSDRRVVKNRCVTSAFVNALVDALQSPVYVNVYKYHDAGTGTGNEAAGDTTLGTPWGGARVAGTQVEGASANIYKTVATIEFTGTFAITEHGIFSASTGGTLMDRSKFAAINVGNGDKIEFTYEITFPSGG